MCVIPVVPSGFCLSLSAFFNALLLPISPRKRRNCRKISAESFSNWSKHRLTRLLTNRRTTAGFSPTKKPELAISWNGMICLGYAYSTGQTDYRVFSGGGEATPQESSVQPQSPQLKISKLGLEQQVYRRQAVKPFHASMLRQSARNDQQTPEISAMMWISISSNSVPMRSGDVSLNTYAWDLLRTCWP